MRIAVKASKFVIQLVVVFTLLILFMAIGQLLREIWLNFYA
jgi:hypothetical protein